MARAARTLPHAGADCARRKLEGARTRADRCPGRIKCCEAFQRWLAVGPTPGQPPEAQCPIEDSAYQKGVVWCLALSHQAAAATCVGDFAIACLRKVPMLGAVSQKVGFACAQALGSMECNEAVGQLTRLRAKVTYSVARRLIEKSLRQAAERNGLTVGDLEDLAVPLFALDAAGTSERAVGEQSASDDVDRKST